MQLNEEKEKCENKANAEKRRANEIRNNKGFVLIEMKQSVHSLLSFTFAFISIEQNKTSYRMICVNVNEVKVMRKEARFSSFH